MAAGSATPERAARRVERKVAKVLDNTHGGYAGPSIIEILESHLLKACLIYLAAKESPPTGPFGVPGYRGIIRGLAEGVAIIRNPYTATSLTTVKLIEREFIKRARQQLQRTDCVE